MNRKFGTHLDKIQREMEFHASEIFAPLFIKSGWGPGAKPLAKKEGLLAYGKNR